jgi:hypothetical protein
MDLVRAHFSPLTVEQLTAGIVAVQDRYVAEGLTSFQDVNSRGLVRLQAYEAAEADTKLRGYLLFTIDRSQDAAISFNQSNCSPARCSRTMATNFCSMAKRPPRIPGSRIPDRRTICRPGIPTR